MVLKKASSAERFLGTSDRRSLVTNGGAVEGAHTTCATVTASPALAINLRLTLQSVSLFFKGSRARENMERSGIFSQ